MLMVLASVSSTVDISLLERRWTIDIDSTIKHLEGDSHSPSDITTQLSHALDGTELRLKDGFLTRIRPDGSSSSGPYFIQPSSDGEYELIGNWESEVVFTIFILTHEKLCVRYQTAEAPEVTFTYECFVPSTSELPI